MISEESREIVREAYEGFGIYSLDITGNLWLLGA